MFIESVLLYIMRKPGLSLDTLVKRYNPYVQPMVIRNILDVSNC